MIQIKNEGTKKYEIKKELQFDDKDMNELYQFFKYNFKDHKHPLALLSIANSIANILRNPKNENMRQSIHLEYEKDHAGHITKINQLATKIDLEKKKKDMDVENTYKRTTNKYDIECSKVILSYLGGEESIEDTLQKPMNEYVLDKKYNHISTKRNL